MRPVVYIFFTSQQSPQHTMFLMFVVYSI